MKTAFRILRFTSVVVISATLSFAFNGNISKANTYYVSTTGDNSNPGSLSLPWKTIGKAASLVNPGDTVFIRGGIYLEYITLSRSGTADNRITFEAFPGEIPVIDGSGKTTNPANPWAATGNLVNVYAEYITIRGLELKNSAAFGIEIMANYCVVDKVHVHHCYFAGVYFYKCSYGTVTNCIAHDFYDYGVGGTGGGGNADGMGSSAGNTQPYPDYGYHVFRNNLVYNTSDDGIDTWSSRGNIVENNIVHHAGYANKSNGGSLPVTWGKAMGNGNGFKCGGASTSGQNILRNNISYRNVTSGFDENGASGNKYYNNTAFKTVIGFRNISENSAENNLSYNNSGNFTGGSQINNSWNLGITDPKFVSIDPLVPGFLRLSAESPAINAGVDLSAQGVLTDKSGISRPQGAGYDLGAYEWSSLTDIAAPVISGVISENITKNSANITWTTDESSNSQVEYGTTTDYGNITMNLNMVTAHNLMVVGLLPSTLYHYRVISTDATDNFSISGDYTFRTYSVTGIFDIEPALIKIYPNPAKYGEIITLESDKLIAGYTIFDFYGNLVAVENNLSDRNINIDKNNLSSGIYLIRLKTIEGLLINKKLIIQK